MPRYSGYETKPPNLEVGQPELKYALGALVFLAWTFFGVVAGGDIVDT